MRSARRAATTSCERGGSDALCHLRAALGATRGQDDGDEAGHLPAHRGGEGNSGAELAQAIEGVALQLARSNYALSALLPGDPPIACFRSLVDPSKLPIGAR